MGKLGMRRSALGALVVAALALVPGTVRAADTTKACDDFVAMKTKEKDASDAGTKDEKVRTDGKEARTQIGDLQTKEGKAKDAEKTAQSEYDKAVEARKKAEEAMKTADQAKKDADQKVKDLEAKVASFGTTFGLGVGLTQASRDKSAAEAELATAKTAQAAANADYAAKQEDFTHAGVDMNSKKGTLDTKKQEHTDATGKTTEAKKKEAALTAQEKETKAQREKKLNDFVNEYRKLAVSAQRCPGYQPSELGISLTMTRFKTAKKILGRVLESRPDAQKNLFGSDGAPKVFSGDPKNKDSDLLAGFGSGQLPAVLRKNLQARFKEADDARVKAQQAIADAGAKAGLD